MIKNKRHICFNLLSDSGWNAGNIYIFNCVHAICLLPEQERNKIFLSVVTRKRSHIPKEIVGKLDAVYVETWFHLVFHKLLKLAPSWLRLKVFNIRKIDFLYPGSNLPNQWIHNWASWIPDFQYRYLPHLFSKKEYQIREERCLFAAKNAPVIAFSSNCALKDYQTFFPNYLGKEFLLRFVSNADKSILAENPIKTQQKFNLPDYFFIVCNQFWQHKDHSTLLEAMALLNSKNITITVVCTGATDDFRNQNYFPSLLEKAKILGVDQQFKVLGFISRQDQMQLIRRSLAIIQPSLFEGWSTVVEDGRALGKTIFLSDFPVHIEQQPPYAHYFKMKNPKELADLIANQIGTLKPGPDELKEQQAYQENQKLMIAFGKKLLEMADK
jgi:glycosyltransferase involved in cell wall biosynthesis